MHEFITFTIGGLAAAGIYAITASGLTLTYTTTGIFNWAHGAIGMVCAFAYWQMSIGWGWPMLVSMFVCLFVLAPVNRHRDRSGGDAPARRCLGGIQTGRHVGRRAHALGCGAMDLEPHDLSGAAPPLQQRHLGPRVDQDLLQ